MSPSFSAKDKGHIEFFFFLQSSVFPMAILDHLIFLVPTIFPSYLLYFFVFSFDSDPSQALIFSVLEILT